MGLGIDAPLFFSILLNSTQCIPFLFPPKNLQGKDNKQGGSSKPTSKANCCKAGPLGKVQLFELATSGREAGVGGQN